MITFSLKDNLRGQKETMYFTYVLYIIQQTQWFINDLFVYQWSFILTMESFINQQLFIFCDLSFHMLSSPEEFASLICCQALSIFFFFKWWVLFRYRWGLRHWLTTLMLSYAANARVCCYPQRCSLYQWDFGNPIKSSAAPFFFELKPYVLCLEVQI